MVTTKSLIFLNRTWLRHTTLPSTMKPPNIFKKIFPEFREAQPFGMRENQPIFCVLVIDDKDHLNFQHSSLRFQTISTCFDHYKNTNVMKTQDFVKEVSDRNNPLKKLADKI